MYRIIIGKVAQKENVIDPALLLSVKHGIWSHLVKWIFFQFRKHSLSQIKLLNRVCTFASASYQYNQYKEAKTGKLWSKSRCWEAWRRRWWSVSARRWVIGDKISVWPDFGQAGATLPARSEELSLPIVRRERDGGGGFSPACPAIQSQATRRPESSSSARSPQPRRCSFCREEEQSGIGTETFERSRLQSFDLELSRRRIGRYFFPGDSRCPGVGLPGLGGEETIRFTSASFSSNCCRNLILRLKVSESDLMLWDCEGLGEKSAVLTKSAQKMPVLTKQHPHSPDRAYPHQKHFDRCCNSRSEIFHFSMCFKAVFNQWNWIEFFERLVRSTFVKTSYKEENVLFPGAAMQCEN